MPGAIPRDAVANPFRTPELLDVEVDQTLPGFLKVSRTTGSSGAKSRSRDRPARRNTRLTVAGETPVSSAM
jgi:hypothetical protein